MKFTVTIEHPNGTDARNQVLEASAMLRDLAAEMYSHPAEYAATNAAHTSIQGGVTRRYTVTA